jgi:hypothetical protein
VSGEIESALPPSPERLASLRHLGISEILRQGRERVALARAEIFKSAREQMPMVDCG